MHNEVNCPFCQGKEIQQRGVRYIAADPEQPRHIRENAPPRMTRRYAFWCKTCATEFEFEQCTALAR